MTWNNYGYMTKEQKLALEQMDAGRKALHSKILDTPRWRIHLIRSVLTHQKYEVIEKGADVLHSELKKGVSEQEALDAVLETMYQHSQHLKKQWRDFQDQAKD